MKAIEYCSKINDVHFKDITYIQFVFCKFMLKRTWMEIIKKPQTLSFFFYSHKRH